MKTSFALRLAVGLLTTSAAATAANWPGWRGPAGTGVSTETGLPLKWGTNENVRWRVDLPGRGNSSPIVWNDRVFVTQAVNDENRRTVMCFDRATGKLLWQSGVTYADREPTQRDNPYCAATPVTDGQRVIASFGSAGLYCYDFAGKELWNRQFGKMNHMFGNAASPILAGDLCILNFGPDEKARLIAVNKNTGETVWEVDPPTVDPSELNQGRGSFAGGRGGPGGGAGGGRGGLGSAVAPQMFAQADKNANKKVTADEFADVANLWFDKIAPDKGDRMTLDQFSQRFYDAVPRSGEADETTGGSRASRTTAPAFFNAADTDKDGTLTRSELKQTFSAWIKQWDADNTGGVDEQKFRDGLNASLPRTNFAGGGGGGGGGNRGPGGGAGGPGGGRGGGGPGGSWSTPLLIKTAGRDELIVNFPHRLAAYDPRTGDQLWISKGLGGTIYTTPVAGNNLVFGMTSGPGGGAAIAVKPGGSGDVTESHRLWRLDRAKSGIGSGVIHQDHLYTISQDGIAVCLDLKSGDTVWEERLRGESSRNSSWSSILLADGHLYIPNQSGDVFVLRAAPKFEIVAVNSVREPTNASLAAADGALYLRTDKGLWCFAKQE